MISVMISPHLTVEEVRCKGNNCCGGSYPLNPLVADRFEYARSLCGDKAINVSSGFRCLTHNRFIGSSDHSQHPKGLAIDMHTPEGFTVDEFANILQSAGFDGIGRYPWGCHGDMRGQRARWDRR